MRIVVGLKWVPRIDQMRFDSERKTLIREGVESLVNPPDLNALEMGLSLRDEVGGEVVAVSMGPPVAIQGVREAMARGADKGVLLTDRRMAGADTLATSRTLAAFVEKLGRVDLILVGEETIDSSTGQVGPGIAAHLDIPFISHVNSVLGISGGKIVVGREVERGYEVWELSLPALLTVEFGCNKPRRPTIRGWLRAKREAEVWSLDDLNVDERCVGFPGSPTIVNDMVVVEPPQRRKVVLRGELRSIARDLARVILGELGHDVSGVA